MKLSRLHHCGDLGKQPAPVSGDVIRANLVPLGEHRAGNTVCQRCPRFLMPTRSAARHSPPPHQGCGTRSEEHTSELQSRENLVCRLLLEKKKQTSINHTIERC